MVEVHRIKNMARMLLKRCDRPHMPLKALPKRPCVQVEHWNIARPLERTWKPQELRGHQVISQLFSIIPTKPQCTQIAPTWPSIILQHVEPFNIGLDMHSRTGLPPKMYGAAAKKLRDAISLSRSVRRASEGH